MRAADFDIQKLIEALQGTLNTLDGMLEELCPGMEENDLSAVELNELDNSIFLCPDCGWWCEESERSPNTNSFGEDICEDCADVLDNNEN